MPKPQTYKNHTRLDPAYHYIAAPILLLNFVFAIYATIHTWPSGAHTHLWWIVVSAALIILVTKTRTYALKVQDRIIRLEERQRLAAILSPSDVAAAIAQISEAQLIALRFAPDDELAALVHKTLTQNLAPKAIKQNIVNWRADNFRV